ncbi:MAG TPA: RNA polymerase sigma factor, partial [Planctomycetaceae bacterium]|nr:RNA polymerase sigma factor [Planctomycetaceae bacterium]
MFHRRVYRLMVRMVGQQDAADVTQEVFLQVFRTIAQYSGSARFETWLYRLAVNQSYQHLRR